MADQMEASTRSDETAPQPGLLVRAARGILRLGLTGATIALAVAAVVLGSDWIASRAAATDAPAATGPIPVNARPITLEDGFDAPRRFLGQVEAGQRAALSFEFGGNLAAIAVDEGDPVAAGDVLARLDTALLDTEAARLDAQVAALSARLQFAEQSLARRAALRARGFSPDEALDSARADRDALRAQLTETEAALENVRVRREKSALTAPFAGRVGARMADTGATVGAGQTVVEVLEDAGRVIRVGLPTWVDPAAHPDPSIEIAGRRFDARLDAVRPDIDPATRTRTVLYRVDAGPDVAYGETAALTLTRRVAQRGAWVPLAALREGLQGVWTVLVVDAGGVVRASAVEVLHSETDRAFVTGAFPDGTRLIETGPHRVTPGQRVRVIGAEG